MTKVSDIIKDVRYILVDSPNLTEARGWSDDRLVSLIDEAQKDICKNSRIFKREYYVPLAKGVYTYDLPDDFISSDRFMNSEKQIPSTTMNDLDEYRTTWRTEVGDEVYSVIQDSVSMNKLEIYPRPSEDLAYIPFYRWTMDGTDALELSLINSDGFIIDTEEDTDEIDNPLGVIVDMFQTITPTATEYFVSLFGTMTDVTSTTSGLQLRVPIIEEFGPMVDYENDGDFVGDAVDTPNIWGVITDVSQREGLLGGTWGVVNSGAFSNSILKVRYSALPATLEYVDSNLSLPDKWAVAIKYYVAGFALLDDNDAKNSSKGTMFLQNYQKEITRLIKLGNSTDASSSSTSYRNIENKRGKRNGFDYGRYSIH